MSTRDFYLVIEGNIGAGKTSLATMLARDLQANLILEEFAENSFLPLFYEEPEKYAFPLELSFLAARYRQLTDGSAIRGKGLTIADYHIEKSLLFANINLDQKELELYRSFFNIISPLVPKPDLVVYLNNNPEKSLKNIASRGRDYELAIENSYIETLHDRYVIQVNFFSKTELLKIDSSGLDFVNKDSDYQFVKGLIEAKLSATSC